jgi:hypothetical protein
MTILLDQAGYDQTKSKLQALEARLSAIQQRSDLVPEHKERVIDSYRTMRKQYLEELRLFEAAERSNQE